MKPTIPSALLFNYCSYIEWRNYCWVFCLQFSLEFFCSGQKLFNLRKRISSLRTTEESFKKSIILQPKKYLGGRYFFTIWKTLNNITLIHTKRTLKGWTNLPISPQNSSSKCIQTYAFKVHLQIRRWSLLNYRELRSTGWRKVWWLQFKTKVSVGRVGLFQLWELLKVPTWYLVQVIWNCLSNKCLTAPETTATMVATEDWWRQPINMW